MTKKNLDPTILIPAAGTTEGLTEKRREKALLKTGMDHLRQSAE